MELSLLRDKVKKNRVVFLAVFFGVYMFEYMVTLTFIDQGNIGISTPSWQLALHYIDYLMVVFGFVSFALFRRGFKTEKARIRLLVIPNLVYFVSVILLYFLRSPLPYSALAMLAAFSLGVLGGMVYFCISMALSHTPYMGRVMAAGACGAVLLQYLLQEYLDIMFGIPLMLALGFSATLCVAMFGVFNPILFGAYEDYSFNMCLYYVCLGASVAYFNLMFWNVAPRTPLPELWAGMGRIVSGVADCVLAATPLAGLPLNVIIGIDILMFVVLVVSLAAGGYLLVGEPAGRKEAAVDQPELSPQQRLKLFAESYALTPREEEVLEKLLTTEDGIQEIADSLYISRRMVQRYVSSIYEKTETKTRLGLFQRYISFKTV